MGDRENRPLRGCKGLELGLQAMAGFPLQGMGFLVKVGQKQDVEKRASEVVRVVGDHGRF